jgi:hypothetical protein
LSHCFELFSDAPNGWNGRAASQGGYTPVSNDPRPLHAVTISYLGAGPDSYIYLWIGPSLALSDSIRRAI